MKRGMRILRPHTSRQRGFTIVELLIVIVIIGILAAIVIVAYNGIQAKARNSQTASVVQTYRKALIAYAVDHNNQYPIGVTGVNCLGTGYPDLGSGSPPRDCQGGTESPLYTTNPNLDNALKPYIGNKQLTPSLTQIHSGGNEVIKIGVKYLNQSLYQLQGSPHAWWLEYVIEGKPNKCPIGPVYQASGDPWYNLNVKADFTEEYDDGIVCNTPLPNPSTL